MHWLQMIFKKPHSDVRERKMNRVKEHTAHTWQSNGLQHQHVRTEQQHMQVAFEL